MRQEDINDIKKSLEKIADSHDYSGSLDSIRTAIDKLCSKIGSLASPTVVPVTVPHLAQAYCSSVRVFNINVPRDGFTQVVIHNG